MALGWVRSSRDVVMVTSGVGGINAYQVVIIDPVSEKSIPADGENDTHAGLVVGMALVDIAEDATGPIQLSGEIVNPDWSLGTGKIYFVGLGGTITDTPPARGFCQKIGVSKDDTGLIIDLGDAIKVI